MTLVPEDEGKGRPGIIPPLKPKKKKKRESSLQVVGPRLFNSLPKYIRRIKNCSVLEFKEKLYELLGRIPDEPKISGLMPINFQQSNRLLHQIPSFSVFYSFLTTMIASNTHITEHMLYNRT